MILTISRRLIFQFEASIPSEVEASKVKALAHRKCNINGKCWIRYRVSCRRKLQNWLDFKCADVRAVATRSVGNRRIINRTGREYYQEENYAIVLYECALAFAQIKQNKLAEFEEHYQICKQRKIK